MEEFVIGHDTVSSGGTKADLADGMGGTLNSGRAELLPPHPAIMELPVTAKMIDFCLQPNIGSIFFTFATISRLLSVGCKRGGHRIAQCSVDAQIKCMYT